MKKKSIKIKLSKNIIWVKTKLGLEIRNGKDGIHIVVDNRGRSTGEAFVQFTSPDDTENALKKNRDKIGHRSVGSICNK